MLLNMQMLRLICNIWKIIKTDTLEDIQEIRDNRCIFIYFMLNFI